MTDYHAETGEWVVEWLEGTTKERDTQLKLPRLRVHLSAEDPFNFADRVADAHASGEVRKKTERAEQKTENRSVLFAGSNWHIDYLNSRLRKPNLSTIGVGCRRPFQLRGHALRKVFRRVWRNWKIWYKLEFGVCIIDTAVSWGMLVISLLLEDTRR